MEIKGIKTSSNPSSVSIELYRWGCRYFTKAKHTWYDYLEELSPLEVQELFSYFVKNVPGSNPLDFARPVEENSLNLVKIKPNSFPRIKVSEFFRLLKLYTYFLEKTPISLEVGCLLFYNKNLNLIKFVLPTQTVESGSWNWDTKEGKKLVFLDPDVEQGAAFTYDELVEKGWEKIGTTHSHHSMNCTWSLNPTGDLGNQAGSKDKPLPPNLHLLVYSMKSGKAGLMPSFSFKSSVNTNGCLVDVSAEDIIEDDGSDYDQVVWVGGSVADTYAKPIPTFNYQGKQSSYYSYGFYKPGPIKQSKKQILNSFNPYQFPSYSKQIFIDEVYFLVEEAKELLNLTNDEVKEILLKEIFGSNV